MSEIAKQSKRSTVKATKTTKRARKAAKVTTARRGPPRNAKIQAALYEIASAASAMTEMQEFYAELHRIVGTLMDARNFFIALHDAASGMITFPYWADEATPELQIPPTPLTSFRGLTGVVFRTGKLLHLSRAAQKELDQSGETELIGDYAEDWLGVPLKSSDSTLGALVIQSYTPGVSYNTSDEEVLTFVAQHIATALERARAIEETRQRNAELTIINSAQQALASQLDFQSILAVVGEKIREFFDTQLVAITLYDRESDRVLFPYIWERGETYAGESKPHAGFTGHVIDTGKSLIINERMDELSLELGSTGTLPADPTTVSAEVMEAAPKAGLYVPILLGNQVFGVVALNNFEREHVYSESDQRLLETLASALGIALQNARLFDETKRLFKQEQQRAAELEIINSVQQGLASKLDIQAIYDLVGAKIRGLFDAQTVFICSYDPVAELAHFKYVIEKGIRYVSEPLPIGSIAQKMLRTFQPVLLRTTAEFIEHGVTVLPGTEMAKSGIYVPLIVAGAVKGWISLQNVERENVFGESDVRLLSTLAASMSVALENARLFDETQRLFKQEQDRAAELAIINSVQQALASKLDLHGIYEVVGEKISAIFAGQNIALYTYDSATDLGHSRYVFEDGVRVFPPPTQPGNLGRYVIRTGQSLLMDSPADYERIGSITVPGTAFSLSGVYVPLRVGNRIVGVLGVESAKHENAFDRDDLRLLETLASSMSVALENARLFDETQRLFKQEQQRAAELAIINSVQQGLASQLDLQAIIDLIGDKVAGIFKAKEISIRLYDAKTNLLTIPYAYEAGQRLTLPTFVLPEGGFATFVIRQRQTLVINQDMAQRMTELGSYVLPGTNINRSFVGVPILSGDRVLGMISLENEQENAFSEPDVNLLVTLASSMGVALENARLFDETQRLFKQEQQRAAELEIINSVQQALASKLDIDAIYELVGDKIQNIFDAQVVLITSLDRKENLSHIRYAIERGQRLEGPPSTPAAGVLRYFDETHQSILINRDVAQTAPKYGFYVVGDTEDPKSILAVPLIVGDEVKGAISLQNLDREDAFSEPDVRLLETLASSMGVALENARLFDETQRLFKQEQQRAAELAIINSVQQGLASKLDFQSIIDLVGDKIYEIFRDKDLNIRLFDREANLLRIPYIIERGVRLRIDPTPITWVGFGGYIARTRQPLLINENIDQRSVELGSFIVAGTESERSFLGVPILSSDQAIGIIALSSFKEHAFTESDVSLLTTLASSMGVALENARLFDETQRLFKQEQQRAAELQIINSVQQGLVAHLDMQGIFELVGEKIREIFDAQVVTINSLDMQKDVSTIEYGFELGERVTYAPSPLTKLEQNIVRNHQTILVNQDAERRMAELGAVTVPGTAFTKSNLFVPMLVGDQVRGYVSLQNVDHDNAFSETDVRLLETLANSMSIAIENARLFDETQRLLKETEQRAAELAIINSVQQGLASKLDLQSIIDLVGDKIQQVFDAQVVTISLLDPKTKIVSEVYALERGERVPVEAPRPIWDNFVTRRLLERATVHLADRDAIAAAGTRTVEGTEPSLSVVYVPLVVGDQMRGTISLQNLDRENAFSASDVRLLETLASSMSVALENARLFDETQRLFKAEAQRAAELAIINSVQQGLASRLDFQSIIDLVGDKIREIFDAQVTTILLYDRVTNMMTFPYGIERGERYYDLPRTAGGFSAYVIQTREALLINRDIEQRAAEIGKVVIGSGEMSKSYLGVPIIVGDEVIGLIDLQNLDHEDAFSDSDVNLLKTLASSLGVALQNARLFDETQRRATEMAALTDIGREISATLDLNTVLARIANNAQRVLHADTSAVFLLNADGQMLEPISVVGESADVIMGETFALGNGIIGSIAQSGLADVVHDTDQDPRGIQIPGTPVPTEREQLMVAPLVLQDRIIGALTVWREKASRELFTQDDLAFLVGLARQASIGIQNARLYSASNDLLRQSQQRAAELELINSVQQGLASKLDMQGIYDLVGDKIRDIFDAQIVTIGILDPDKLVNMRYVVEKGERLPHPAFQMPVPLDDYFHRTRDPLVINYDMVQRSKEFGFGVSVGEPARSLAAVPLFVGNELRGVISLQNIDRENAFTESDVRLLQTLASSMSVALENARLFDELQKRNREVTEALEQQTATSEILRVIAESPTDIQPVLDAVVQNAARLCEAQDVLIFQREPDRLRIVASGGELPAPSKGESFPIRRDMPIGRVILDGKTLHIEDHAAAVESEYPPSKVYQELYHQRTVLATPLLRKGVAIGLIYVWRAEVRPFADKQIELLKTFADQAAIAIENVRLFDQTNRLLAETKQRAAELELINSVQQGLASKLDIQGIYDLVGDKIRDIFNAQVVVLTQLDYATELILRRYIYEKGQRLTAPPGPFHSFVREQIRNPRTIVINDQLETRARELGMINAWEGEQEKSLVSVPLVVGGRMTGSISLQNIDRENAFSESDVRLLQTLASSMSVALENARLFDETVQRANEMAALTDIGREVTATLDLQTVLHQIATRARDVLRARDVAVRLLQPDGTLPTLIAIGEYAQILKDDVIQLGRGITGDVAAKGVAEIVNDPLRDPRVVHIAGTEEDEEHEAVMFVPLLLQDRVIGVMTLWRDKPEAGPFSPTDLNFGMGLARQAAVAIQNARLFEGMQQRTRETEATSEILRIIGSSPTDIQPVLNAVVRKAIEVCDAQDALILLVENGRMRPVAGYNPNKEWQPDQTDGELLVPLTRDRVGGRAILDRTTIHIPDILEEGDHEFASGKEYNARIGSRTMLATPLWSAGQVVGTILLRRDHVEPFTDHQIDLLKTFADQAVIAIENARLFDEIQRSKEYNEAIVQTSPVAIVTVDLDFRVVSWNPGAETLFGYTAAEAIGRNIYELHSKRDELRRESTQYGEEIKEGKRVRAITQRSRKDGSVVDVEMSGVPVIVNGKQTGNILIYHDITELVRARREAEAANQAKSAFLATMSHEIRTPMNAVIGMSNLLLDTTLNDEQHEYADIIRNSGEALLTIINDILDFSKIEAGKMELEAQPLDVRDCVESALDLVATRAAEKGLDLAYIIDPDVPHTILGDVTRLRQILLNLLNNAVKFTEKGEVVLTVSGKQKAESNKQTETEEAKGDKNLPTASSRLPTAFLHFAVRDTGIGIPADRKNRLFQSFSQVDAATSRKYGGTGLGLAISKRLAEMMGGEMWVESEGTGKGSTFEFTIRTEAVDEPVRARRDLSGAQPQLEGKRVLVVDDNATNRHILVMQTRSWGMVARDTGSPREALDWIKRGDPFDVAILDMHMPEMDGIELSLAIRNQRDPQQLPIIFFTSLGRRESGADSAQFAAYLTKPIKPSQLFDALANLFVQEGAAPVSTAQGGRQVQLDPTMAQRLPLRILLAEDNAVNQKLALRLLQQMGYRADVAGNGIEAIQALERQKYDVVLMDVQMPEMDGLEASRRITTRWKREERPRIIGVTANAMQGDREACLAAGMEDYITKPIRVQELVGALSKVKPVQAKAEDSALDAATFQALKANMGDDFIGELIDTYLEDAPALLAEMKSALASNNVDGFRRAAHSLKSNSANFGANALAGMAKELEMMGKAGNLDGAGEKIARVEKEYERVKRELEGMKA